MFLKHLILRSFRNYDAEHISFERGVNLIQGRNRAGKSSLLEAIFFLSTGRSFRTSRLTDLIKDGSSHFYVEAHFEQGGIEQVLGIGYDGHKCHMRYNHTQFHSFSQILGIFPSVLYAPKDGALISGAPAERRRFLNIQLAQTTPLYVYHLTRYHRAMKQRNTLLKQKSERAIGSFEQIMADSARYLMRKRDELIRDLKPRVQSFAHELSFNEDLFDLFYLPSISMRGIDEIEHLYAKQRARELTLGVTLHGPHRDDLLITCEKKEAKRYISEGQKRTCIASLKIAEWEEMKEQNIYLPIMNIDDFGIHLDTHRTHLLYDRLRNLGQVFLTTPLVGNILDFHSLYVEGGALCKGKN